MAYLLLITAVIAVPSLIGLVFVAQSLMKRGPAPTSTPAPPRVAREGTPRPMSRVAMQRAIRR